MVAMYRNDDKGYTESRVLLYLWLYVPSSRLVTYVYIVLFETVSTRVAKVLYLL